MRSSLVVLLGAATAAAGLAYPPPVEPARTASKSNPLIVDLGLAGTYHGVSQNNGTVHSWKAIPYAAPPVGELRFKAPRPLKSQNSTVQDVSQDFPDKPTACIQAGIFPEGPNGPGIYPDGPGVEDCLKLWIWAPADAKEGDNLAVHFFSHGGGMVIGQSQDFDFSDWVGQDQKFIAVNANYRLGTFGFWNGRGQLDEGEPGNNGLVDTHFAIEWVYKHISKFGGDPNNIAVSGESGGAGVAYLQLALYNGTQARYKKAIPRSIQRVATFTIPELLERNDALALLVNCTDSAATKEGAAKQLACLRNVPATAIQAALPAMPSPPTSNGWPQWLPSIDGVTLMDQPTRLYREGRIAKVPVLAGFTTNEIVPDGAPLLGTFSDQVTTGGLGVMRPSLISKFLTVYPPPLQPGNASYNTNTPIDNLHRYWGWSADSFAKCASPMVVTGAVNGGQKAWEYRWDAPMPPESPFFAPPWEAAVHSSDNYYLQNATATYNNDTMVAVALEFRAYLASFLRHTDPNVEKLATAPYWHQTSSIPRYAPRLLVSLTQGSSPANTTLYPTSSAMELADPNEWDRCHWWSSDEVIDVTLQ